jgi:hypothetical protein
VNIASHVQGLAAPLAIFTTTPVIEHPGTAALLAVGGLRPLAQQRTIRGVANDMAVYEIP